MEIVFTGRVLSNLSEIISHIAADDPSAATNLKDKLLATISHLQQNPRLGRHGRVADTRELIAHPSYIVAYRIIDDTIQILTVYHASRQWPENL